MRASISAVGCSVTEKITLPLAINVSTAVKPKPVTSAADAVSAAVSARAQGARVEVEELRDEFSTTWVNPDGSFTTQAHAGVQRFKDAKGSWRNVDLNLVERSDGTVGAKSHPLGVSLADKSKGAGNPGVLCFCRDG